MMTQVHLFRVVFHAPWPDLQLVPIIEEVVRDTRDMVVRVDEPH
jgi:hypothetical protein